MKGEYTRYGIEAASLEVYTDWNIKRQLPRWSQSSSRTREKLDFLFRFDSTLSLSFRYLSLFLVTLSLGYTYARNYYIGNTSTRTKIHVYTKSRMRERESGDEKKKKFARTSIQLMPAIMYVCIVSLSRLSPSLRLLYPPSNSYNI